MHRERGFVRAAQAAVFGRSAVYDQARLYPQCFPSSCNPPARGNVRCVLAVRRPSVEPLEGRVLLTGASIAGTVFEDVTGNGVSAGDALVPGRVIHLFRDNGDSALGAGDALVKNDTTGRD